MNKYQSALDFLANNAYEYFDRISHFWRDETLPKIKAELQELVEKATPQKVKKIESVNARHIVFVDGRCPTCGNEVNEKMEYCPKCGQALDWSEEE